MQPNICSQMCNQMWACGRMCSQPVAEGSAKGAAECATKFVLIYAARCAPASEYAVCSQRHAALA
eukprot:2991123-Pleurochrysis_carterae.AAC.4